MGESRPARAQPSYFDHASEIAAGVYQRAVECAREPARPSLVRLISNPDALAESARTHCQSVMRETGRFAPRLILFTPQTVVPVMFEDLPGETEQIILQSCLQATVEAAPIGAYWFGSEIWMATADTRDATIHALPASERENKREGLMIISATRRSYRTEAYETERIGGRAELHRLPPGPWVGIDPLLGNLFEPGVEP